MADCSDLQARLAKVEAQIAAAEKLHRSVEAQAKGEAALAKKGKDTPKTFRTFSMADGTKIKIDPTDFYRQVEADNLAMGEDALRETVRSMMDKKAKPQGSKGRNINYSQMPFTRENALVLLELMGQSRSKTDFGQELMMPFTQRELQ